jgi:hypothetical protein
MKQVRQEKRDWIAMGKGTRESLVRKGGERGGQKFVGFAPTPALRGYLGTYICS